jgi:hypothetical protein
MFALLQPMPHTRLAISLTEVFQKLINTCPAWEKALVVRNSQRAAFQMKVIFAWIMVSATGRKTAGLSEEPAPTKHGKILHVVTYARQVGKNVLLYDGM